MLQQTLAFSKPTSDYFPLYAQPKKDGFFGLSELQRFTETLVEPYFNSETNRTFVLDFSLIKIWDVAAILWLIVALHHYRKKGFLFKLRLPKPSSEMSNEEREVYAKSAEYLQRYRFDIGLRNLESDPDTLLVPEQAGYFSKNTYEYYRKAQQYHQGAAWELLSDRLMHIRNLANIHALDSKGISDDLIGNCVAEFQEARISDILFKQCDIVSMRFFENEFNDSLTIKELCDVITSVNENLSLKAPAHTVEWMNELLQDTSLYDILSTRINRKFSSEMIELASKTADYRNKLFSELNEDRQLMIRRLNRLLLEETFPTVTPKSRDSKRRTTDLFAGVILSEALLNMKEHPEATIGMMAISIMGNTNELILSVVDNGKPIPETIYPYFVSKLLNTYFTDALSIEKKGEVIHFATEAVSFTKANKYKTNRGRSKRRYGVNIYPR